VKRLITKEKSSKRRYFVKIFGVVQGVGYRPYVYNQAIIFNIKGFVSNHGSSLVIDIEGECKDIKGFLIKIIKTPPSLAVIKKVKVTSKDYIGSKEFHIKSSSSDKNEIKFIAADVATCPDCIRDIFDETNPRYQYVFTNCTSCGPRYSIIKSLPYDRINTIMETFKMCPVCNKEYSDPTNRRFHAQPNCCPSCGPSLKVLTSYGEDLLKCNPIIDTINYIKQGKIVGIKGLGGFHLSCDAKNEKSIEILRNRKNRPHKPLAIMVKDIETAKRLCFISEEEEKVLLSNKRPIVLLRKKDSNILPKSIAPNLNKIGIMLPYTPLHYLLFQNNISHLVMTSGNMSGESIQYKNDKAIKYLGNIVDYFLIHNREINISVEDSVVKLVNGEEIVVRRARGYTPFAINIKAKHNILALGAEQKSTFSLSQNGYAYISQYLGDLKDFDSYNTYKKAIRNLMDLLDFKPNIIAYDLHPYYLSSKYGDNQIGKKVLIQHHHAHMVSCMVEHNLSKQVIGVVFDGTGLGNDGKIWGGEFLVGNKKDFIRVGHFKYVAIQGGDKAIKQPWRIALSYLHSIKYESNNILKAIDEDKINMVKQALDNNINCYETSSIGRLFDCVAALLNIRHEITYDAQGAIELENIMDVSIKEDYDYLIKEINGVHQIYYEDILLGILKDIDKGVRTSNISTKFHNTIGNLTIDLVNKLSKKYGIKDIVLSGGVFGNEYLLTYILNELNKKDFNVYYNKQIPTNDSGISLGQLAIANSIEGNE